MDSKRLVRLFEMIYALPFRDVKTFLVYCCSEREKTALLVYNIVNSMIGIEGWRYLPLDWGKIEKRSGEKKCTLELSLREVIN